MADMVDARSPNALFEAHHVDPRRVAVPGVMTSQLRDVGLVTVTDVQARTAVVDLASSLLRIVHHRDSQFDGLTVVQDTGRHSGKPGFTGLTNTALAAHTERSGTPEPPRLMLLACAGPADEGGESLLIDGCDVWTDLARNQPHAVDVLSDERTAFFGGQDGVFAPVFRRHPGGRLSVRLRLDDLVRWNPLAQRFVPALTDAIARHCRRLQLGPGDAYLIDNHRWLHARTAFTGPRRLYRALGAPLTPMPEGFSIHSLNKR